MMTSLSRCTVAMSIAVALACGGAVWAEKLDEGLLDLAWFGADVEFRATDEIDYLWVKPGLDLAGRTLHIDAWDDPLMLAKKKRDAKDAAKASELTDTFPGRLRGALTHVHVGNALLGHPGMAHLLPRCPVQNPQQLKAPGHRLPPSTAKAQAR